MTGRAQRSQGHEDEQGVSPDAPKHAKTDDPIGALAASLNMAFMGVGLHLDKISAQVEDLRDEVHGPYHNPPADDMGLPKVRRRRSLDDMQFALKRLASGEPRPADDDSVQVLEDAVAEVVRLRLIMNTLMQASNNVYQSGLVATRNITAQ